MATTKTPSDKRLRGIWYGMVSRCRKDGAHNYDLYGAAGIDVCDEWTDYDTFASWAYANGYDDNLSIDRISNDKGYNPDNCRWATAETQANNRTNNRHITYGGITLTHSQWARVIGVTPQAIYSAIKRGIDGAEYIERHLDAGYGSKTRSDGKMATITIGEETHSIKRWAAIIGVSPTAIYHAMWAGKTAEEYIQSHLRAGYGMRVYGEITHPTDMYKASV